MLFSRSPVRHDCAHGHDTACVVCALYSVIAYGVFESFDRRSAFDLLRLMRGSAVTSSITTAFHCKSVCRWSSRQSRYGSPHITFPAARFPTGRHRVRWAVWIVLERCTISRQTPCGRRNASFQSSCRVFARRSSDSPGAPGLRYRAIFSPRTRRIAALRKASDGRPAGFQLTGNAQRPRNVIVVILESVATKYMSLYGSRYATTPNLLAESRHACSTTTSTRTRPTHFARLCA
jgi:hypothetical protein